LPLDWICKYGYYGLFGALLGIPFPGETLLTFAGYLVFKGDLELVPAFVAGAAGSILGITLSYAIGRLLSTQLARRWGPKIGLTGKSLRHGRRWFERWGRASLALGFFIPGMRDVVGVSAGATRLRYPVFALIAYPGGALWVICYLAVGYWLGERWVYASRAIGRGVEAAASLAFGLLAAYVLWRLARRWQRRARHHHA